MRAELALVYILMGFQACAIMIEAFFNCSFSYFLIMLWQGIWQHVWREGYLLTALHVFFWSVFSNILTQTTVIMKCIQAEVLLKRGKDLNIHLISFVACIYIILQFFSLYDVFTFKIKSHFKCYLVWCRAAVWLCGVWSWSVCEAWGLCEARL